MLAFISRLCFLTPDARLIFKQPKFSHITPLLCHLHWLPIRYRIEFKILLLCFKAVHGMAPSYICKLISFKIPIKYELRSNQKLLLKVPSGKMLPTLGVRAFSYAVPRLWNDLPSNITGLHSLPSFKRHLKTHLFTRDFNLLSDQLSTF